MMKRLLILLLLTASAVKAQIPATCSPGSNIYYISSGIGLDSRTQTQAKSKSTPWAHAPYMHNFTGTYSHTAGDCFVFRGGDTWTVASFVMNITQGGTASAQDYYGVDLTWFTGGSFTRPLFDLGNSEPAGNIVIVAGPLSGGLYVTIDNIEIKGQSIDLAAAASQSSYGSGCGILMNTFNHGAQENLRPGTGTQVTNVFIHDWVGNVGQAMTSFNLSEGTFGGIQGAAVVTGTTVSDQNGTANGSPLVWGGGCHWCGTVSTSHFTYGWFGIVYQGLGNLISIHDNEIDHIYTNVPSTSNPNIHPHMLYDNQTGTLNGNVTAYNNAIHDLVSGGIAVFIGYNSSFFNNVLWNIGSGAVLNPFGGPGDNSSQVGNWYNNTIDSTGSTSTNCMLQRQSSGSSGGSILGTFYYKNNFCIGSGQGGGWVSGNQIFANNLLMTSAQAITQGYSSTTKYKAFPGSAPTAVLYGVNLTSLCSQINLTNLCKDTEGAQWFGASSVTRPTGSTAWDAGAYQSPGSGGGTPPTVTVTSPAAGTISGNVTITVTASGGTISSIQPLVDGATFGNACTASPCSVLWDTTKVGNGAHTVGGTATNGTGQGTATPVAVTVNNITPGCTTSSAVWQATSFTTQAGAFTATLTVTPNGVPPVGSGGPIVGLSQSAAAAYSDNATLIRQSDNGFWEVYNGLTGTYGHQTAVSWIVGTAASFTWSVDVVGKTASVHVTQGGVTSTLATGYTFRAAATSISDWNLDPSTPPVTLQVCNFALGATGALTPASFNFGTLQVGNSASQVFTLTNNGGSPLTVSAYTASPSVYSIPTNTCVSPIAAGGSCLITIQFAPTSPTSYPGTLHLTTTGTINDSTLSGAGSSISVPSVPAGLTATVSGTTIALSWTASTGTAPITYSVLSSTTNGGPYASLATGLTSTSYSDTNLVNGSHYYVVNATNAAGTSANSAQATGVVSVTPQVNLSPASLAFGNVRLGASGSLNETVANVGNANLVFNTPAISPISGPNAADFAFASGCTDGSTVAANASCSFLVTFTPSATGTQEQGTLCTSSNSPTNPDCVTLTGSGVAAVTVLPASLSFGNIFIGKSSASQTVTFTNQSGATVTFSSIALTTGTNYAIGTNTCGGSVADGASCTVAITFTPTAVGTLTDTLTFTDSAAGSPHTVALTGNGKTHHILKVGAVI